MPILRKRAIIEVIKVSEDTIELKLDGNAAGRDVKKQMQEFGNLLEEPVFESLVMTIKINDAYFPVSLKLEAVYEIKMSLIGKAKCHQTYVVTYRDIKEDDITVFDEINKQKEQL